MRYAGEISESADIIFIARAPIAEAEFSKEDGSETARAFGFLYADPENNPLTTPTGKLEYYSTEIAEYIPDDPERPPVPHWIEAGESHDERLSSARAWIARYWAAT